MSDTDHRLRPVALEDARQLSPSAARNCVPIREALDSRSAKKGCRARNWIRYWRACRPTLRLRTSILSTRSLLGIGFKNHKPGMTGAELYSLYTAFGEDPFILGGEGGGVSIFSAWNYAKNACGSALQRKLGAATGTKVSAAPPPKPIGLSRQRDGDNAA